MKQFFEQYGGIALGILALLVLIAMITPMGNIIKTSLQGTVETFSTKMDDQTDTMTTQMSEIFENAKTQGFLEVKDSKLYVNGEIFALFSNGTISSDYKTITFNEGVFKPYVDFNVIDVKTGRVYTDGIPGLYFGIYVDEEKYVSDVIDRNINNYFNEIHTYKAVIKNIPSGVKIIEEPKTKNTVDLLLEMENYAMNWKGGSGNEGLYITYPIFVEVE